MFRDYGIDVILCHFFTLYCVYRVSDQRFNLARPEINYSAS